MTDDFHFDTEIIIKLQHQRYAIKRGAHPDLLRQRNLLCERDEVRRAMCSRAVRRYKQTCRSVACLPEFQEYFVHYPIKHSQASSHYYARQMVGSNQDVLDIGAGKASSPPSWPLTETRSSAWTIG